MSDAVNRVRRDYQAIRNSGNRKASDIRYFVIHTAEAPLPKTAAEAVGRYFEGSNARGSTTFGVDVDSTQRYLSDLVVPWGAPPLNVSGLHVECAGKAAFDRKTWLQDYGPMFRRLGWLVATSCKKYGIPMVLLGKSQLKRLGVKPPKGGITTHDAVSDAWGQSDHWDPGKGFPMDVTMAWVEWYGQPVIKQKVSKPVLHLFTKGKMVTRLQNDLAHHGFFKQPASGVFNAATETAVKAFQRDRGLKATGVVDLATWKALDK